jgi:hypothetical protein
MKRKRRFMRAVQILAPDNPFVFEAAQRIPEEKLPLCPGATALEFEAVLMKLLEPISDGQPHHPKASPKKPRHHEEDENLACIVVKNSSQDLIGKPVSIRYPMTLPNALRVRSAEYWVNLGQPDEALRELEKLSSKAMNHPWVAG